MVSNASLSIPIKRASLRAVAGVPRLGGRWHLRATYLTILLVVNHLAGPVLDHELSELDRQEGHLWKRFNLHLLSRS